jgi:hypothetical protein
MAYRARAVGFGGEWWTLFRHEFIRFLWSPWALVPMVIYSGFSAAVLWSFRALAEMTHLKELNDSLSPEQREAVVAEALKKANIGNAGDVAEYVRDHVPLELLGFFLTVSFFLPLLVAVVSFDQFSELSTRGARFALLRVRRETYFIGKAAAGIVAVTAFLFVMWAVACLSTVTHSPSSETYYIIRESVRGWLLMSVTALPYLAFTATVSAFVRPVMAFILTFAGYIGLSIVWLITAQIPDRIQRAGWDSLVEPSRKILLVFPWDHLPKLISRDTPTVLSGVFGVGLIALFVYGLALYVVRRRDV